LNIADLQKRVSEAIRSLMIPIESGNRVCLNVPITYPSGSSAIVEIEENSGNVWVSDMGMGLQEAQLLAVENTYHSFARKKAREFRVEYDGDCIFALWVSIKNLEAAIVSVSNASVQATAEAVRKASEIRERRHQKMSFEKISDVFSSRFVRRSAEVRGANSPWTVHNFVEDENGKQAIFEPMTDHFSSISGRYQIFSDLAEAGLPISLNVIVEDSKNLDPRASMVSKYAKVIDLRDRAQVYRERLLAA